MNSQQADEIHAAIMGQIRHTVWLQTHAPAPGMADTWWGPYVIAGAAIAAGVMLGLALPSAGDASPCALWGW